MGAGAVVGERSEIKETPCYRVGISTPRSVVLNSAPYQGHNNVHTILTYVTMTYDVESHNIRPYAMTLMFKVQTRF